ncbi:hypothetical protein [Moritella yayanosii]|uniref:Uncharacterized protein n=1 Tax=Moritella yayanosii TaxID=69539 RepID=A0A330LKV1_9GAMM|nr:hypothetical protein [Moritella yayanosii]SQD77042.1 protein of unknown function [Moritella yayanosii]
MNLSAKTVGYGIVGYILLTAYAKRKKQRRNLTEGESTMTI